MSVQCQVRKFSRSCWKTTCVCEYV